MMKHMQLRAAILAALRAAITEHTTFLDGRPVALTSDSLPAIAVYISDAQPVDNALDEALWQASLHVELFEKAEGLDSTLDEKMAQKISPVLMSESALQESTQTFSTQRYDYRRDEEGSIWRSADLEFSITYYQ
ncbi:phage minor tail U family protein [Candidatus Symbiopectobacterium sp. NZEC151]|uniref:phage minor tail U family protein n=1 Tax=Candidatus Symbiopectobacterium sp. NZEC151 TaxID=2820470 RepID=UPI002227240A|nr:phage minor tail U family protein [Candidatus Symbiopectobacterium sp. NZEC151]MCW2476295.1 phage tail protein [Candidatus Symbiopectobacterium sp. NZEC151]